MIIKNWVKKSDDYWRNNDDYVAIVVVDSISPHRNLYVAKSRRWVISDRLETLANALASARKYMRKHP